MSEQVCVQDNDQDNDQNIQDQNIQEALSMLLGELSEILIERPHLAGAIHTIAVHLQKQTAATLELTSGQQFSSATASSADGAPQPSEEFSAPDVGKDVQPVPSSTAPARLAQLPELPDNSPWTQTDPEIQNDSSKPRYSDVTDDDLSLMAKRCRIKAEGTLWALEREERLRNDADFHDEIRPTDHEIIQRARQVPNCFLWMNQPRDDIWTRAGDYDLIADCYDALAESLTVLDASLDAGTADQFLQAVNLTAEAQSALRSAVARVEKFPDSDQQMAYHWLRNRANLDRFYIARYMKISDPADPDRSETILTEAAALLAAIQAGPSETEPPQEFQQAA